MHTIISVISTVSPQAVAPFSPKAFRECRFCPVDTPLFRSTTSVFSLWLKNANSASQDCKVLCHPLPNSSLSCRCDSRFPFSCSQKSVLRRNQHSSPFCRNFSPSSRWSTEFHFKVVSSRESSGKVGSSTNKQNTVEELDQEFRSDGEVDLPGGSNSSSSSSSSEGDNDQSSSYEYLDTFLSMVDKQKYKEEVPFPVGGADSILETLILISPFFLWGTAMVAMKGLLPKAGPMFVASVRLIPAGFLLVGYGYLTGKKQPTGVMAWLSIALFALVDASCFQGFLAEGLKRTTAGLGSVIIDSQPLTVAILAALIFGESLDLVNYAGLALGIVGLFLLELPSETLQSLLSSVGDLNGSYPHHSDVTWMNELISWERGEWRMLLAAQSMAVGTVMIRWVCQYSDPFMATGWHMVLGGIPLFALSVLQQDPALSGHIQDLNLSDWSALLYTSVAGSAVSYGLFFYNATRGSLTKLSSLTFLTPMFAALFGFLFLSESLTPVQFMGGVVTLGGVLLVNYKPSEAIQVDDGSNK